jgi:hypothetical protein
VAKVVAGQRGTETLRHRKVKELNDITEVVIGCAIEVHRLLKDGIRRYAL